MFCFRSALVGADPSACEWNDLVIEAGENTLTLDLHPRLTVVAGIGQRRARGPDRRAHRRAGRQPSGAAPRARGAQRPPPRRVPAHERSAADRRRRPGAGRHRRVHRRRRRLQPARPPRPRLAGRPPRDALRRRRPGDEQQPKPGRRGAGGPRPATSVERRRRRSGSAEGDLTSEAEAIGSAPEDAAMIEEVEARHNAVEQAADRFETTRKRTFWIGGGCALATIPGVSSRPAPSGSSSSRSPPSASSRRSWPAPGSDAAAKAEEQALVGGRRHQLPRLPAPAGERPARQRHQPQGAHGRRRRSPAGAGRVAAARRRHPGRLGHRQPRGDPGGLAPPSRGRRARVDLVDRPQPAQRRHRRARPRAGHPPGRGAGRWPARACPCCSTTRSSSSIRR